MYLYWISYRSRARVAQSEKVPAVAWPDTSTLVRIFRPGQIGLPSLPVRWIGSTASHCMATICILIASRISRRSRMRGTSRKGLGSAALSSLSLSRRSSKCVFGTANDFRWAVEKKQRIHRSLMSLLPIRQPWRDGRAGYYEQNPNHVLLFEVLQAACVSSHWATTRTELT